MNQFDFSELMESIVGPVPGPSDSYSFVMVSDKAPKKGDDVVRNGVPLICTSCIGITNDEQTEQGQSYSKVTLKKNHLIKNSRQ